MQPDQLWKEAAKRAATSVPVLGAALVALGTSFALVNPLPALVWAVGAAAYVLRASSSPKNIQRIIDEERVAERAKISTDRQLRRERILELLRREPFATWIRRGELPNYGARLVDIEGMRDEIERIARERTEVKQDLEKSLVETARTLVSAYLQFIEARLVNLQILTGIRTNGNHIAPAPSSPLRRIFLRDPAVESEATQQVWASSSDDVPSLDLEAQSTAQQVKLEGLRERAARGGGGAAARQTNIGVVEEQLRLLVEIRERDDRASAQLDLVPDCLSYTLTRVSASSVNPVEISDYLRDTVETVARDQEFVEQMQPMSDRLLHEIELAATA
ncbi:MAG: hypothetical protein Q7S02_00370 [bacterium]|nr:hypothetical protein [bacterium]